jgi:hypothetical protein
MNRLVLTCAAACTLLIAACGRSEIVVQAQVEGPDGQPIALRDLPFRAVPFDRDAIFDSLRAAYGEPEPQIPADLMSLRDSMAQYQEEWRIAETRWGVGRDSLQKLSQALRGMNPASGQYVVMFREFNELEPQVTALQRQSEQAFQRFQNLQNRYTNTAQDLRLQIDAWGDAAFADVERIMAARERDLRRPMVFDTTDANGLQRTRLSPGEWWIYAHYDLPFEELYWNVPVTVARGEPTRVQLTRETAQVRPKL